MPSRTSPGRSVTRRLLTLIALLLASGCARINVDGQMLGPAQMMDIGAPHFDRGHFEAPITAWQTAAPRAAAADDKLTESDARTSLAAAQMMIGRYDLAVPSLRCALARADESADPARK